MIALTLAAILCSIPVPGPEPGTYGRLNVYEAHAELCYHGDCRRFDQPSPEAHQQLLGQCLIAERSQ